MRFDFSLLFQTDIGLAHFNYSVFGIESEWEHSVAELQLTHKLKHTEREPVLHISLL